MSDFVNLSRMMDFNKNSDDFVIPSSDLSWFHLHSNKSNDLD